MMKLLGAPVFSDAARRAVADYLLLDRGYDSLDSGVVFQDKPMGDWREFKVGV